MVEVFAMHLMPYMDMPEDFSENYETSWVTFPNSYYDPQKGHSFYNQFIEQLKLCADIGFDGVAVNEHHQNAYGNMPSPNLIAAILANLTQGMDTKIAILGNIIPLHDIPQRVAEEIAMLDVISGGRIISGFVRGVGAEYFSYRNVNPSDSKARFFEAHDLIKRAWTETGPFEFRGKYYDFPYVNIWPRPIQDPPPIWTPSAGSKDTVEFAAKHRYTYAMTALGKEDAIETFNLYRQLAEEKFGYRAQPSQLCWSTKVYVAETDEKARDEFESHVTSFFEQFFNSSLVLHFPPGYVKEEQLKKMMGSRASRTKRTMEQMFDDGNIVFGSPETVKKRLTELHQEMGFGVLNLSMHTGDMPHWKTVKSIDLFGRHVLPHIQKLGE
ncbi:LLM class flavin-dependent oxidoreductase [Mesobacillus harenae]|uniref:LLM class flavin-dependent oxidoreductase n=1 Tax=Mesobacillus harenae TaxID=2213203 RepID=UPI0015810916|nr:LLM class flavin-dependent oxidoreductase [Mesobacillus harenae]